MQEPTSIKFAGEPRGSAYEAWREEFCRKVISCDLSPLGGGVFEYEVSPFPVTTRVALSWGAGSALGYKTLAQDDRLVLVIPQSSRLQLNAGKRQTMVLPGQAGINDSGTSSAEAFQCDAGAFASVIFDRRFLIDACPGVEDLIASPLSIDRGALELLCAYERLVRRERRHLNAALAAAAAQHLLDLTVLTLYGSDHDLRNSEGSDLAGARFEIVKADILATLSDQSLDVAMLAGRHKVSVRYLQYLFENAGTTFTEFVLEQRLLLALRLLRSPVQSHRKISDIALLAGFNSISYFHRAFRRRFGNTPAEAREANK